MRETVVATPFGRRPMTLALLARQVTPKDTPLSGEISKWQIFQHVREAREALGATDRSLAILNALLSFHPETMFSGKAGLIVWPSNEQLAARANGMSLATLRRHLACLLDCGLIIRRDSPNGKRFARKSGDGTVVQAYGFDLSPLLSRAGEFRRMAERVATERNALKLTREHLTICRRDIVKLIETGRQESVPYDWDTFETRYRTIVSALPRKATKPVLDEITAQLDVLRIEITKRLKSFLNVEETSPKESQSEPHIQESKPDSQTESKKYVARRIEEETGTKLRARTENVKIGPMPLSVVLDACSNLRDLAGAREIRSWRDFAATTAILRPMLRISPAAWDDACAALGENQAGIALGAIYQRSDRIGNPGGYLRTLSRQAKLGKFSTLPMIMALRRSKTAEDQPSVGAKADDYQPEAATAEIPVSDALLRSLSKGTTQNSRRIHRC